jgi:uncharacterized protein (UPF0218 family)
MKALYRLKNEMRDLLAQPLEGVYSGDEIVAQVKNKGAELLVSVGDECTLTLLSAGITPDISIIDYKTQRNDEVDEERLRQMEGTVMRVKNPMATITDDLWNAIDQSMAEIKHRNVVIVVDGEEDLASLAVIAQAPKGTIVIYGLPNRGIARIVVSDFTKGQTDMILRMMEA